MSAFLGPIHYWLYNKIIAQKKLTADLAGLAISNGWISEDHASEYVARKIPALEEAIDTGNIHGWLQERINWAETRYAEFVTTVLSEDPNRMEDLKAKAYAFGRDHAVDADSSAEEAYKAFDDTFVNGMPCDRVNVVTEQSADRVSWEQAVDIHERYWHKAGGDPEWYYDIRTAVMRGMLEGSGLALENEDAGWSIHR